MRRGVRYDSKFVVPWLFFAELIGIAGFALLLMVLAR